MQPAVVYTAAHLTRVRHRLNRVGLSRYKATRKREFKLPWRKAVLLISIKWTRTSRLSIKISLSL